jgi:ElaB/YqjD/DUF883 family membrane-anchored ribosome-binding protein
MSITAESLAPQAQKALAESRKAAVDAWDRIAAQGSELRENVASSAVRLADRTRGYVEHQPVRSLVMAAAAGAVAAVLVEWFARHRHWR